MREIMNAKQTQVHPWNPSQGWLRRLSQSRSVTWPNRDPYRINDPSLSCRLEANALIEQGFELASDIPVNPALSFHDPRLDLRFPDHVCGLQSLHADLIGQRGSSFADPDHLIAGAAVLALQPDGLSHSFNSRRRYQAGAVGRNLISTAILRFQTGDVREYLDRHSQMQPPFQPFINSCCYG
jgi:hypothetical protein